MNKLERKSDRDNAAARAAWDCNAGFWDSRMGEGNDFFQILIWPPTERFLDIHPGDRLLDVACGNGLTSRRAAELGARVIAVDFSTEMIETARRRTESGAGIDYQVIDATDENALLSLGRGCFQAVLCNMALFDMVEIAPLLRTVPSLLAPEGRFVFSILHPCFNNSSVIHIGELEDRDGEIITTYSVKISRYINAFTQPGLAMHGQPVPHPYFHRSLTDLIRETLKAGLIIDGFEERTFPPSHPYGSNPLSWGGHFSEIPPVLVCRMRPVAGLNVKQE